MNPQKEKGRRAELKVAQLIRQKLGIEARRSPYSGASDFEKADIFAPKLGWHIEIKNREHISVFKEWQKIRDFKNPVLVITKNHSPILAVLDFEMFLDLIKDKISHNVSKN